MWARIAPQNAHVFDRLDFEKLNFIPFGNFQAKDLEFLIDFGAEHDTPILRWAHDMVDQNRDIVIFVDEPTYPKILSDGSPIGKPIHIAASCAVLACFFINQVYVLYSSSTRQH